MSKSWIKQEEENQTPFPSISQFLIEGIQKIKNHTFFFLRKEKEKRKMRKSQTTTF